MEKNFFLRQVTIYSTFSCKLIADKPRATLTAGTTIIPVGGSVTLTCSVQSSDGWKYEWFRRTQRTYEVQIRGKQNRDIRVSQGGIYRCRGTRGNPVYYTDKSDVVTIEKTCEFSHLPSWTQIYSGETVTVRCEIQGGEGAQWTYEWRAAKLNTPPTSNEHRIIRATESDSGGYSCRGRRDYFFSEWSDIITLTVSYKPRPVLTVSPSWLMSPDRVQHFTSDSVSLTCEGNFTEWRVRKFSEDGRLYSDCRRMTGSTCNINTSESDTAVYWCESGSGEFSSAVNITVQNDGNGPILVSPVHPVTEGASVSLSCSLRTQKILSNVFFYHNDKLIQNDTRGELKISAVSKSDEGFYKCQYSGRESAQSWMSVKGDSSFSLLMIFRLILGFLFIFLPFLLFGFRCSKGENFFLFIYFKHKVHQ
uniref:Ig-like domain-containing protein n=1 Tax=Oreochromis aureus TaxID=47969 RepID=A0AAZ1XT06_OREAU